MYGPNFTFLGSPTFEAKKSEPVMGLNYENLTKLVAKYGDPILRQ